MTNTSDEQFNGHQRFDWVEKKIKQGRHQRSLPDSTIIWQVQETQWLRSNRQLTHTITTRLLEIVCFTAKPQLLQILSLSKPEPTWKKHAEPMSGNDFLLLAVTRLLVLYSVESAFTIYRGDIRRGTDRFTMTPSFCAETAGNGDVCGQFHAVNNTNERRCDCLCPYHRSTFIYHNFRWMCLPNDILRRRQGIITHLCALDQLHCHFGHSSFGWEGVGNLSLPKMINFPKWVKLKNKQHHSKVPLNSFLMNGNALGFCL